MRCGRRVCSAVIWMVISVDQLDLLAKHAAAKILNRHFRGFDRPLAAKIGVNSRLIVEDADLDALRRRRRARKQAICGEGGGRNWITRTLQIIFSWCAD